MDTAKSTTESATGLTTGDTAIGTPGRNGRGERGRRRSEMTSANVRYFLPKAGNSGSDKPELGREMTSEGEALVEAFRTGQLMYTLVAWKAVPEMSDDGPKIVKQAINRT